MTYNSEIKTKFHCILNKLLKLNRGRHSRMTKSIFIWNSQQDSSLNQQCNQSQMVTSIQKTLFLFFFQLMEILQIRKFSKQSCHSKFSHVSVFGSAAMLADGLTPALNETIQQNSAKIIISHVFPGIFLSQNKFLNFKS